MEINALTFVFIVVANLNGRKFIKRFNPVRICFLEKMNYLKVFWDNSLCGNVFDFLKLKNIGFVNDVIVLKFFQMNWNYLVLLF